MELVICGRFGLIPTLDQGLPCPAFPEGDRASRTGRVAWLCFVVFRFVRFGPLAKTKKHQTVVASDSQAAGLVSSFKRQLSPLAEAEAGVLLFAVCLVVGKMSDLMYRHCSGIPIFPLFFLPASLNFAFWATFRRVSHEP